MFAAKTVDAAMVWVAIYNGLLSSLLALTARTKINTKIRAGYILFILLL